MRANPNFTVTQHNLIFNPDLPIRLEKVLKETLDERTRNLLLSFQTYLRAKDGLTPKQHAAFEKIESHFSPQAKEIAAEWSTKYDDSKREILKICAHYYVSTAYTFQNKTYFTNLCRRALDDPNFVPTEQEYDKLTKNKYVAKVLQATFDKPKFKKNDLVLINKSAAGPAAKLIGRNAFIVVVNSGPVTSACKGAKKYKILPFGHQHMIEVEERFIKKVKKGQSTDNESQHNVQDAS